MTFLIKKRTLAVRSLSLNPGFIIIYLAEDSKTKFVSAAPSPIQLLIP